MRKENRTPGSRGGELEARVRANSRNFSTAPFSGGLREAASKSMPSPCGLRPNGQAGQEGTTLRQGADPDVMARDESAGYGSDLGDAAVVGTKRARVLDVPPIAPRVVQPPTIPQQADRSDSRRRQPVLGRPRHRRPAHGPGGTRAAMRWRWLYVPECDGRRSALVTFARTPRHTT